MCLESNHLIFMGAGRFFEKKNSQDQALQKIFPGPITRRRKKAGPGGPAEAERERKVARLIEHESSDRYTMHSKFSNFLCFSSLCAHLCAISNNFNYNDENSILGK